MSHVDMFNEITEWWGIGSVERAAKTLADLRSADLSKSERLDLIEYGRECCISWLTGSDPKPQFGELVLEYQKYKVEVETDGSWRYISEDEQAHPCTTPGCTEIVAFDDEPWCFTHSPDSGSNVLGYSYKKATARL